MPRAKATKRQRVKGYTRTLPNGKRIRVKGYTRKVAR